VARPTSRWPNDAPQPPGVGKQGSGCARGLAGALDPAKAGGRVSSMVRALAFLAAAWLASPGYAAAPPATTQAEIEHLLVYLEQSGCEFFRNGRWHSAADARRHLERKYGYLVERGVVSRAEDFIAHAGSRSSMSGRPYQVRCGTAAPVPSARWLADELRRHRSGQPGPR
jgi:Family of unknown function (DUF5329)